MPLLDVRARGMVGQAQSWLTTNSVWRH
jgi:hypothetical protein